MTPVSLLIGYHPGDDPFRFIIFIGIVAGMYVYLLRDGTIKTIDTDLTCYGWIEIV